MAKQKIKTIDEYVSSLMDIADCGDAHVMGSLRETVFFNMESIRVPHSMREQVYSAFKEEYWQQGEERPYDDFIEKPVTVKEPVTPVTPKPDVSAIDGAIADSVRVAGSGRWLVDIQDGNEIKTKYVDSFGA